MGFATVMVQSIGEIVGLANGAPPEHSEILRRSGAVDVGADHAAARLAPLGHHNLLRHVEASERQ